MKRNLPFYAVAILGALNSTTANATDASLYAEAPPDDASFVRFVGFGSNDEMKFGGKSFSPNAGEKLAYTPVSTAALTGVKPGSYVTVIRSKDGAHHTIPEGPRADVAKVSLYLVNATDQALDLRLADGSVTIINDVAPMASGLRAVNPVAISFGVFQEGDDAPLATFDVSLRRGQNITFLADHKGVRLVENRFGAVAK